MGHRHCLGGIGDQISGYQRIFHADMSHGDTVTDCDSRKYPGHAARQSHSHLYRFHDFIQVHMTRYDFII